MKFVNKHRKAAQRRGKLSIGQNFSERTHARAYKKKNRKHETRNFRVRATRADAFGLLLLWGPLEGSPAATRGFFHCATEEADEGRRWGFDSLLLRCVTLLSNYVIGMGV